MTNMLHRVLWGRGDAEPQQIPLAITGEEAEVMAASGGGVPLDVPYITWCGGRGRLMCFIVSAGDMDV